MGLQAALLIVIAGVSTIWLFVYTPLTLFASPHVAQHPHLSPLDVAAPQQRPGDASRVGILDYPNHLQLQLVMDNDYYSIDAILAENQVCSMSPRVLSTH